MESKTYNVMNRTLSSGAQTSFQYSWKDNFKALRLFLLEGNAEFCEQLPKEDFDVPVDTYNRPLK